MRIQRESDKNPKRTDTIYLENDNKSNDSTKTLKESEFLEDTILINGKKYLRKEIQEIPKKITTCHVVHG